MGRAAPVAMCVILTWRAKTVCTCDTGVRAILHPPWIEAFSWDKVCIFKPKSHHGLGLVGVEAGIDIVHCLTDLKPQISSNVILADTAPVDNHVLIQGTMAASFLHGRGCSWYKDYIM